MPAPRRTVGGLGGSGAAGVLAGSLAAAGLGELGAGTGTLAAAVVRAGASIGGCVLRSLIGASGPGLTPAAGASADFMTTTCAFSAITKPATARAHNTQIAT